MIDRAALGDRHLRTADGLHHPDEIRTATVRILVDDDWSESIAGQLLVSCLVNLLCRQAGIVRRIEIAAKDAALRVRLPSGTSALRFPKCLEELSQWATDGAVPLSTEPTNGPCDYAILVGEPDMQHFPPDSFTLLVIGDGWRAWIGEPIRREAGMKPSSRNPLGPFLAAALASGEVFKRSRGIIGKRGNYLAANGFSLWSGNTAEDWNALEDGPELSGHTLPPTHVVGVGAVGNAFAYVICSTEFSDAYLALLDDDSYDGTNLNRCLLAGCADISRAKVDAIVRALGEANIGAFPFPHAVNDYLIAPKAGLRLDAAREADNLEFKIVLSCVDKGISRQQVQRLQPESLIGASTLDLRAQSNVYGLRKGSACLGCHNRAERDGDKLRALEGKLRDMNEADRRQFSIAHALNPEAVEEYIINPRCGSVGETTLRDFATRPPQDFSAGFVSLTAGLLLSSALFRQILFPQQAPERGDMTTMNFLNGGYLDSYLAADPDCELQCGSASVENHTSSVI